MADWSLPSLTSSYSDFLTYIKDRDTDIATMFASGGTNLPTNAIRWNATSNTFEKYSGATWSVLTANLLMTTNSLYNAAIAAGTTINDSAAAATNILWTSSKVNAFSSNFYTKAEIEIIKAAYVAKNGENGPLILGTNDANSVTIETSNTSRVAVSGTGNVTIAAPSTGTALTITPAAGSNAITATGAISGTQFTSTVATGTAPLVITSTSKVTNLNADFLDNQDGAYYQNVDNMTAGTLAVLRGGTGVTTSTGTGNNVLSSSPTLVTPSIGVATGTSFNSITGLASVAPLAPAVTAVVGVSTLTARQDHVHPTNFTSTSTDIKMNGTQSVGALTTFPRADHVHPVDTSRAPLASPTFTGTVVLPSTTSIGTITNTELSYLDGVTSSVQTQIDGKIAATNYATSTVGGTVKARLSGTTLYLTIDGTTA